MKNMKGNKRTNEENERKIIERRTKIKGNERKMKGHERKSWEIKRKKENGKSQFLAFYLKFMFFMFFWRLRPSTFIIGLFICFWGGFLTITFWGLNPV